MSYLKSQVANSTLNQVRSDKSDKSDRSDTLCLTLLRFLANDFFGVFVFAKAQERRLAEVMVASPLGEADLANEFGLQPRATPHLGRRESLPTGPLFGEICKWTIGTD